MRISSRRSAIAALTSSLWNAPPIIPQLPDWLSAQEQLLLRDIITMDNNNNSDDAIVSALLQEQSKKNPMVTLIGDATHGTQEFYQLRSDITKLLIQNHQCDAVLCEGDVGPFLELNRRPSNAAAATPSKNLCRNNRFPTWMWCNDVMDDFIMWLHEYNNNNQDNPQVLLLGMDIYNPFDSIDGVLRYLEQKSHEYYDMARQYYYSTLSSFRPDPKQYSSAIFNNVVESQEENVKRVLDMLLLKSRGAPNEQQQELFYALQNARAVVASEAYFRLLGTSSKNNNINVAATWNLRDQAFLENIQHTLAFLTKNKTPPKIVVCAHNSHMGDIRATDHHEDYSNLGRMCRETFGADQVYNIGMTTFVGSVRAAPSWGEADRIMPLTPAFEGSHEYLLHLIAKSRRTNLVGLALLVDDGMYSGGNSAAQELFEIPRVERFVGTSYTPETELRSHYNVCNLSEQFDYVLHVDRSSALRVKRPKKQTNDGGNDKGTGSKKWDSMLLDKYGGDGYEALRSLEI